MCGILGVIRNSGDYGSYESCNDFIKSLFEGILVESEARGTDSTGLAVVNKFHYENKKTPYLSLDKSSPVQALIHVNKKPVRAREYVETKEYKDVIDKVSDFTTAIIGHTRQYTDGLPRYNINNHPHICGNVVGVHNGIISTPKKIAEKFNMKLNSECDSEVIFGLINLFMDDGSSAIEAVRKASRELLGSYACAFVHRHNPEKVVLFKDSWSPIHIYTISWYRCIAFSSAARFLRKSFDRSKRSVNTSAAVKVEEKDLAGNTGLVIDSSLGISDWPDKIQTFSVRST